MEGDNVEIVIGTTEEYLLGYKLKSRKDGSIQLQQTFAHHSHMGSVRQVTVVNNLLVSGSSDEVIRIFNLHSRSEVGSIMEHSGTITHLSFYGSGHLFSAAEDGRICIFNKHKKWMCEKTLRGHKGPVSSVSVHPSGKLALSVGKDKTMFTWNLIKGRKAYITNLKTAADRVMWSPAGKHYLLVKGSCVEVYLVESGKLLHTVDFKQTVSALAFITEELIAVGGEGQNICLYDIGGGGTEMLQWEAHTMRVKCICVLPWVTSTAGQVHLASGSSDGTIKIWKLDLLSLSTPKLLGQVNTTCRIICMDVYLPQSKSTTASPVNSTKEMKQERKEDVDDDKEMQNEEYDDDVEVEKFDDDDDVLDELEEEEEDEALDEEEEDEALDEEQEDEALEEEDSEALEEEEEDLEEKDVKDDNLEVDNEDLKDIDSDLELEKQDAREKVVKNDGKLNNPVKKTEKNTVVRERVPCEEKKNGQGAQTSTKRKKNIKDNVWKSTAEASAKMSCSKKKKVM